jgi:hypothetical protein
MRKGKDPNPDPDLLQTDPDLGDPKTPAPEKMFNAKCLLKSSVV